MKNGFTLNGKRIIIKGVCLHHDLGALGAAALEAGIERRLKILMDMGVNAVRLSHNPYSPEMLALCDRLGLIVWDESFDKWYGFLPDGTGWKDDLKSFVRRDRNHPSVVIWSIGNEMTPHMYMREEHASLSKHVEARSSDRPNSTRNRRSASSSQQCRRARRSSRRTRSIHGRDWHELSNAFLRARSPATSESAAHRQRDSSPSTK